MEENELLLFNKAFYIKNIEAHIDRLKHRGESFVNNSVRALGTLYESPNPREGHIAAYLTAVLFGSNRDKELSQLSEDEARFAEHIMLATYDLVTAAID